MKTPRRIQVIWRDIVGSAGWMSDEEPLEVHPELCVTVGFLVSETKKDLRIASTFSPEGSDRWSGLTVIPKGCVVGRKFI